MKKRKGAGVFSAVLFPALALLVLLCFLSGISNLTRGSAQEEREQLEAALRRAAVACYASEGTYPPDLAYLEEHYGVQVDRERYTVIYEADASNLMPDITILETER